MIALLVGCGRDEQDLMYKGRMKYAGSNIYIDTETGVCYLQNYGFTVMVNQDGTPYIANGWRDYDE